MAGTPLRAGVTLVAVSAALALAPGTAAATDRYVDSSTGADANAGCPQGTPCATIAGALDYADPGDRVLLDDGDYAGGFTLEDGVSLEFQNFVTPLVDGGPAVIDGGADPAITVAASGAGHIRGVTIRSDAGEQVVLNGAADIQSNTFDDPDATGTVTSVRVKKAGTTITDNTFVDPAPSTTRGRIGIVNFSLAMTVTGNTFTGLNLGVQAGGPGEGTTLIADNTFSGTHNSPGAGRDILVSGGTGALTIRENNLQAATGSSVIGVDINAGVSLIRNRITGHQTGVQVVSNVTGLSLFGDRIWGNTGPGIRLLDTNPSPPLTTATVTNVTSVGNGSDILVEDTNLTLDSSIIKLMSFGAGATCTITYSRADTTGTSPTGCDDFDFTADPMLVNAAAGDFHLLSGSPMIDTGNPATPAVTVDFDGDARNLVGTSACVARRDIGADEFVPASPFDCTAPDTSIEPGGPAEGSSINDVTPSVFFSSDDPLATFQCMVDQGSFGGCSHVNYHILGPLLDGEHTFAVRAVDDALNADATPASVTFTVDTAEPATRLTKKPPKKTKKKRVRISFAADEDSSFECQLDSKPEFACTSPARVRIKPGRHVFRVVATDEAGNPDPTPAKVRFRRVR